MSGTMVPMTAGGTNGTNGEEPLKPPKALLGDVDEHAAPSLPAPDPSLVAVSSAPPSDDGLAHTTAPAPLLATNIRSMNRLFLQLWPSTLFAYFLILRTVEEAGVIAARPSRPPLSEAS